LVFPHDPQISFQTPLPAADARFASMASTERLSVLGEVQLEL
jgi:hypothetical protein